VTGPAVEDDCPLPSPVDAWALTRVISPREHVRVADVDAYGDATNTYTGRARTGGDRPGAPWAVYLTDAAGGFRLLAFDLDAARGDPAADAATLCGWLQCAGLPHVVTASGPAGGRHVWLGLAEAVDAATVDTLARLARAGLPSLDLAPLANPVTGCVRPPGAPHRHGGASTVLAGDLAVLTEPTVTGRDLARLVATLAGRHRPEVPAPADRTAALPVDGAGRLYLPGPRRGLPAASVAALDEDAAAGDASTVLWRVLVGAASARWRCADVAPLVAGAAGAPGLEHVRSQGQGPGRARRTRGAREARAVLHRQWDRAVRWVAAHPRAGGDDPTFEPRAAGVAGLVEHTQARADAAPGRWGRPGGPADRRVLDAVCALALHGVSGAVEADVRRLGLLCGIGRETARTALLRLAADGWIARHCPAEGTRGASWSLPRPSSTPPHLPDRSQAVPRPPPPYSVSASAGAADRNRWLTLLRTRLAAAAHDVFTSTGGLGFDCGQLYAALTDRPASVEDLASWLGCSYGGLVHRLAALHGAQLVDRTPTGWALPRDDPHVDRRDAAAARLGVGGRLADRAARYALERDAWAWWTVELAWMRAPRRAAPSRRPGHGQLRILELPDTAAAWPAHPRRADGRADFPAARRELLAQAQATPPRRHPRAAA
jgi:hypothetical protein